MSITHWIFLLFTAAIIRSSQGSAQVPGACLSESSLQSKTCCPNKCGQNQGCGLRVDINLPSHYDEDSRDVRYNWPHALLHQSMQLARATTQAWIAPWCKYGYYGSACSQKEVLPQITPRFQWMRNWTDYTLTPKMMKTHDSGYGVNGLLWKKKLTFWWFKNRLGKGKGGKNCSTSPVLDPLRK